jgi:hypothetical protein
MERHGQAYLRWQQGRGRRSGVPEIVDHKGASWGSTWLYPNWGLYCSISYLGLALVLTGDTAEAKKADQNFVTIWKDADSDALIQATQGLAALR